MDVSTTAGDVTFEVHGTSATDVSGSSITATDDKSLTDVLLVGIFPATVDVWRDEVEVVGLLLALLFMLLSEVAERIG